MFLFAFVVLPDQKQDCFAHVHEPASLLEIDDESKFCELWHCQNELISNVSFLQEISPEQIISIMRIGRIINSLS